MKKFTLGIILHAHQPATQFPEILKLISQRSYEPLLTTISASRKGTITLDLSGSLLEQWEQQAYTNIFKQLKDLILLKKVEITGTAAYHPLLPKLPETEIVRQIELQEKLLKKYFEMTKPQGFFIPEMFYTNKLDSIVANLGYRWMLLDESAYPHAGVVDNGNHKGLKIHTHLYRSASNQHLNLFFRDRPLSLSIAFDHTLTIEKFIDLLTDHFGEEDGYALIAVDAETFGHHIQNNLNFLADILSHPQIEVTTVSDLLRCPYEKITISALDSTWGMVREDGDVRTFPRWDNQDNPIQQDLWQLFNLAIRYGTHKNDMPDDFDRSLSSDTFWWASGNPCWHPEMIQRGVDILCKVILNNSRITESDKELTQSLYQNIIAKGQRLFGNQIIQC